MASRPHLMDLVWVNYTRGLLMPYWGFAGSRPARSPGCERLGSRDDLAANTVDDKAPSLGPTTELLAELDRLATIEVHV